MSTVTSCYPGELHQGHMYYLTAGPIRIPVWVPPGIPDGQYYSATVSGHNVRFWVGTLSQCSSGGGSVAAIVIAGLLLAGGIIWALRRAFRHLPPTGR